ncbi:hypothetical protein LguiA_002214 [Lonicera macranthoides]
MESEIFILPVPAIGERVPSAILTLKLPAQGEYEEKRLDASVMWSEAPESIIQGVWIREVLRAFKKLPLWAREPEGAYEEE